MSSLLKFGLICVLLLSSAASARADLSKRLKSFHRAVIGAVTDPSKIGDQYVAITLEGGDMNTPYRELKGCSPFTYPLFQRGLSTQTFETLAQCDGGEPRPNQYHPN